MCDINLKNISLNIEKESNKTIDFIDSNSFSLNNTFNFFNRRILNKNINISRELNNLFDSIADSEDPIHTYTVISNTLYSKLNIDPDLNAYTYDLDTLKLIWLTREIFIALTFFTIYIISLQKRKNIRINVKYRVLNVENIVVNIFGSNTFKSDIDITITGKNTSQTIAIIEDLFVYTGWFDNGKWKVDIYGDFMLVGGYYIDSHNLHSDVYIGMIELALIGYFKHSNSLRFDNSALFYLIYYLIIKYNLELDLESLVSDVFKIIKFYDFNDREMYYTLLKEAEDLEASTVNYIRNSTVCDGELYDFFGKILLKLGTANLFRSENYILTPTIVQIVKLEQSTINTTSNFETCNSVLTNIAKCSISEFSKVLCSIEQIGYLQENLYIHNLKCNLTANKYFGRFLRSIKDIQTLRKDKRLLQKMLKFTNSQELIRQKNNDSGLDDSCILNLNLYKIICDILKLP
jgi:hypothetical protein